MLGSCGGGVDTVQNPFTGNGSSANQGPAAANQDVRDFEVNLWDNLKMDNRCGQCHNSNEQTPYFADPSDVNLAYSAVVPLINMQDPASSLLVTRVSAGHNCWETLDSVCSDSIEQMILNWAGVPDDTTARVINLTAPTIQEPGESKNFPLLATDNAPNSFENTVYPLLTAYCASCHYEEGSAQQQAPFFANTVDVQSAYEAAKSKINIDLPTNSRMVSRMLEGHNCPTDCGALNPDTGQIDGDAGQMLTAIEAFANAITPVAIDPLLITTKSLTMFDGIIASGGNRHESNAIAIWEFKAGTGNTAFDTSGISPFMNLTLDGNAAWLGSYGLDFNGGKAWSDTQSSKKLHDFINSSGEYSLEAWVVPANVTQEDANIVSYDAGSTQKNFALTQTLYNYNFHNRVDNALSDANGDPALSTADADEVLQSSLQHVITTYDPVDGRKIYVNGELTDTSEPITQSTSISTWDDTYAFVLGNSAANSRAWQGKVRMLVIHNRALTTEQVVQNFEVGVGQKYFMLFSISDRLGDTGCYEDIAGIQTHSCFIRFEVSQFDSYSYLFEKPTFINLNDEWEPGGFAIRNMRIGINGKEALTGQTFANMNVSIDASSYTVAEGQNLSTRGEIIALEKGADSDEFFLSFEVLGTHTNPFEEPDPILPSNPPDADPVSEIGVRTFEEINASMSAITGVPINSDTPAFSDVFVNDVYVQYKQQLPTTERIDAFLSSHQMAVAQLALSYCSVRAELDRTLPSVDRVFYTDFNFDESANTAFNTAQKAGYAIDPVLDAILLSGLDSQPDQSELVDLLGSPTQSTLTWEVAGSGTHSAVYDSLITEMTRCPVDGDPHYNANFPCDTNNDINTPARTVEIVKAICAAALGSAAMLIQ